MNAVEILTGKMVETSEAYRRGDITALAANVQIGIYADALLHVTRNGSGLKETGVDR